MLICVYLDVQVLRGGCRPGSNVHITEVDSGTRFPLFVYFLDSAPNRRAWLRGLFIKRKITLILCMWQVGGVLHTIQRRAFACTCMRHCDILYFLSSTDILQVPYARACGGLCAFVRVCVCACALALGLPDTPPPKLCCLFRDAVTNALRLHLHNFCL